MTPPDAVTPLALAAAHGDREALAELIRSTQADVWRFVAFLAGRDEADDLTQETYLRMLSSLASFEGRSSALTWLFAIARHVVADRARYRRARPVTIEVDDWGVLASRLPVESASGAVEVALVFDTLASDRREALVLTQVLGLSYADAASVIGCPVGTVRSRVARGRAELLAALAASGLATMTVDA